MTAILAELFKQADFQEIDKVCYFSLGELGPKYKGMEFNMAEKMVVKTIAMVVNQPLEKIVRGIKEAGDLGDYIYKLKAISYKLGTKFSIGETYQELLAIAEDSGKGSVERKVARLASLLKKVDPLSAKYIVRMVVAKLRLGFSSMTILDALSWSETGDKSLRLPLENAFNTQADIGQIAKIFKQGGIKQIKKISPLPGIPVRAAKAERLKDAAEIIDKLHGQCVVEPKFDGFRLMMHIDINIKENDPTLSLGLFGIQDKTNYLVRLFSRNLDNMTSMFPDVVAAIRKLPAESAILDGEAIAFNPKTGRFLPFQETVQRKRKYDIAAKAKEFPLKVFTFDLLYLDGESLISRPFFERRQKLEELLTKAKSNILLLTKQKTVTKPVEFEQFFKEVKNEGLEGLMAKKANAPYRAGIRDHNWVKYKVAMRSELADTIDCVVMGYYFGKGKRTVFGIGAFLAGIIAKPKTKDKKQNIFDYEIVTVSKIGTGLTDEQWKELYKKIKDQKLKIINKPENYSVDKNLNPDVWLEPKIVVEIEADTITKSPIHTAGMALRFPRLKRFRDDKGVDDVTNMEEMYTLFRQKK